MKHILHQENDASFYLRLEKLNKIEKPRTFQDYFFRIF